MKYLFATGWCLLIAMIAIAQPESNSKSMLDFAYPFETKWVQLADSLDIAYVDEGSGPYTLLMIHGLGTYLPTWRKNVEGLREHFRCIAVDLPGYGKSTKAAHPHGMAFFAATLQLFIEKSGLEHVVLVGHSMGSQIAVAMALEHPEAYEALVLLAPAGFETFSDADRQWFANFAKPEIYLSFTEEQIIRNFHLNFFAFPEDAQFMIDDRLYMRQTVEYNRYCQMIPRCVSSMLQEPVFERLSEVNIPTLVIYGENDALIPNRLLHPELTTLGVAKAGVEKLSDARLVMVPQSGHMVQWEGADPVNEAIRAFLK